MRHILSFYRFILPKAAIFPRAFFAISPFISAIRRYEDIDMIHHRLSLFAFIAATAVLAGCSNSVPKCNSDDAKDLVLEIFEDHVGPKLDHHNQTFDSLNVTLDSVRTQNTNDQTGAHECAAKINFTPLGSDRRDDLDITYEVENTDDGDFFISVYGL